MGIFLRTRANGKERRQEEKDDVPANVAIIRSNFPRVTRLFQEQQTVPPSEEVPPTIPENHVPEEKENVTHAIDFGSATGKELPPGLGNSYCTYAPDYACYARGWPSCCNGGTCAEDRPDCELSQVASPASARPAKPVAEEGELHNKANEDHGADSGSSTSSEASISASSTAVSSSEGITTNSTGSGSNVVGENDSGGQESSQEEPAIDKASKNVPTETNFGEHSDITPENHQPSSPSKPMGEIVQDPSKDPTMSLHKDCSNADGFRDSLSCRVSRMVETHPSSFTFFFLVTFTLCFWRLRACCQRRRDDSRGEYRAVANRYAHAALDDFDDDFSAGSDNYDDYYGNYDEDDESWVNGGVEMKDFENDGLSHEEVNG